MVFILLHILGIFLPVEFCWGYDSWGYISGWSAASFALLGLAACLIPLIAPAVFDVLNADALSRNIVLVVIPVVSFLPFWLLRQASFFLGDGYFYIRTIENGVRYRALEPLEMYLHAVFYAAANHVTTVSGETAWALVSALAGVFYILTATLTARYLGKSPARKALLFLSLITIGSVQLYFGYIETYSIATLFVLVCFYLSFRSVENRRFAYGAVLGFGLAVSAHLAMAAYIPAVIYLCLHHIIKIPRWKKRLEFSLLVLGAFLLPLAATLLVFSAGGFTVSKFTAKFNAGGHLLPLWPGKFPPKIAYSMFSYRHFMDMANEYILIAPALSFLPGLAMLGRKRLGLFVAGPITRFLLIAAVSIGLASFIFNLEIGVSRDWDIFSSAAVPITLLVMLFMFALFEDKARPAGMVIIACCFLHTLPWILLNSRADVSLRRFESLTASSHWNKHARSYAYDELRSFYEERNELKTSLEWGLKAYNTLHNERYRTNLAATYNNIAVILAADERLDEAEPYFQNAYRYGPDVFECVKNMGMFYFETKDFSKAAEYFDKALALEPDDVNVLRSAARACYELGRYEEADHYLGEAMRLNRNEVMQRNLDELRQLLDRKLETGRSPGGDPGGMIDDARPSED
jgi:tetratricopeptide (TPR) repeat protein